MTSIDDPGFVRDQYASEENLSARKSIYASAEGPDPREVLFAAVADARPRRVLEVGGGEGELAERIVRELGCELVGVDQSERMVELQCAKGIDARVGDAESLPFGDGEFDLAIAAWMLYHLPDVDRGLAELARVLRPGGRLVAVVNGRVHLRELWQLAGRDLAERDRMLRAENAGEALGRRFARVERHDVEGWVTLDDAAVRRYAASWSAFRRPEEIPPLAEPLRVRRSSAIFVAERR